jgi:serine/threonine protein kinase
MVATLVRFPSRSWLASDLFPSNPSLAEFACFVFSQPPVAAVTEEIVRRAQQSQVRRISDHYELREVLGSGSYAEVRRAVEHATGQEFAVKIIDKDVRVWVWGRAVLLSLVMCTWFWVGVRRGSG